LNDYLNFLNDYNPPEQKEIVIDSRTGLPRQAGATMPEGKFIQKFKKKAEESLFVFSKGVMGRDYLTKDFHLPVANFLQKTPPFRKMLLMARDHAKTSIVSHCLPLHILVQPKENNIYFPGLSGKENRILLAGESSTRAESNLRVIASALESNAVFRSLWPDCTWEKPRRQAKKWSNQQLIIPREIDYPDPSIYAVGVGGAITGSRPTVIIKDDLISLEAANSEVVMRAAIDWHKASRALMDEYAKDTGIESLEFIIGCLTEDAEVTMADGTRKSICDVKEGEYVYSPDTNGFAWRREVEKVIPQGISETWTISTTTHDLRATANHPFLISVGKKRLEWRRADQLQKGDLVVALKKLETSRKNEERFDPEFCWLFGFMLGDGWVNNRSRRGYVCFASGVDEVLNKRVLAALKRYVPCNKWYKTSGGYYRTDSVAAARFFTELNFKGKAKTKRVPTWVYKLPVDFQVSFLRGFCDADGGWQKHQTWRVEISNKDLLLDLRHIACLCGVRTGRLSKRERTLQPPCSPHPVRSICYSASFNFLTIDRFETPNKNYRGGVNVGRDTKLSSELRFERVISIVRNKIAEPVYDLTVKGTPSFFANGLAVHNTRWSVFDLYSYIIEGDDEIGPDLSVEVMIRRIIEDGKPAWPERFDEKRIDQLRREFGSMFYLLYMNEASDPSLVDFDISLIRRFSVSEDQIIFEADDRDIILSEAAKIKTFEAPRAPYGSNLNTPDVQNMLFGKGRGEYLRLKYK